MSWQVTNDADAPFMDAGLDSLGAIELRRALQVATGEVLPVTLVFEAPTARQIANFVALDKFDSSFCPTTGHIGRPIDVGDPKRTFMHGNGIRWFKGRDGAHRAYHIASCACDLVSQIPSSRWVLTKSSLGGIDQQNGLRHGGFTAHAQHFDNCAFFISPAESVAIDPQQRLLLEQAYQALHDSMMHRMALLGSSLGVFVGMEYFDFDATTLPGPLYLSVLATNSGAMAAGRTSFVLDLHGPCMLVGTTCSSGLVSASIASDNIESHDFESALAMAASLILRPLGHLWHARAGALSRLGRCHTFDRRADGFFTQ
jgi:acyl carrier protein